MDVTTMEAAFPSNLERSVASALLLLASSSPKDQVGRSSTLVLSSPITIPRRESNNSGATPESYESLKFSASKSSGGSSETSVGEVSSRDQQLAVVAFMPRLHELKLTIVRKKRSKSIYISKGKKMKSSKPEPSAPTSSENASEITTVEGSSCSSSNYNVQSCSNETGTSVAILYIAVK